MADTLQQTVTVNFQGGGSLPRTLKEMLEQVRQLETASKKAAAAGDIGTAARKRDYAQATGAALETKAQGEGVTGYRSLTEQGEAERERQRRANTATAGGTFAAGMGAITHLSALSDPWGLDRFQKASADLGAVIGRELVPYLRMATEAVRFAADAWVAIPRPVRLLVAASIAAATAVSGLVVANALLSSSIVATTIATVRATAANLTLAGSLVAMGNAAIFSARWLMRHPLIALATVAVGAAAIRNYQKDASFGAAVREPSIGTAESYLDALQLDALKAGTNIAEQQLTTLQEIKGLLDQPKNIVKEGLNENSIVYNRSWSIIITRLSLMK